MAKASPAVRSFNAGEFSALLDGRVDLERYSASVRSLLNYVAAPQGPAIARSGTAFVAPGYSQAHRSVLVPFVFSADQARVLEFTNGRIRIFTEDGLQVSAPDVATVTSLAGAPMAFTTPNAYDVGDEVVLSGFPASYNLNGEVVTILTAVGTSYTVAKVYPTGVTVVNGLASRVYHIPCNYTEAEREALRAVQSVDVMYLFTGLGRPRKLSRFGDYDWRLTNTQFNDGPYMPINETTTTLTPSATGNKVSVLTSDTGGADDASGSSFRPIIAGTKSSPVVFLERDIVYTLDEANYYKAFDADDATYWASDTQQYGVLNYIPATPFAADGYTIYIAKDNQDTTYGMKDYAPSSWTFEGYTGSAWVVLDTQEEYVLYDGNKSVFFELSNSVAYQQYRIVITALYRNGLIEPRIRRLVMREKDGATFTLTASANAGINADTGFKTTDVGRLVRLKGSDGTWRSCEITARSSSTVVTVKLLGEPLLNTNAIKEWRLGYWSNTTGWPGTGEFFEDRLWMAGSTEAPDVFAGSVTGDYENFSQTDSQGTVLDDSAIVLRLNSRKLSRILWITSDTRGLLMGTGSEEYTVASPGGGVLTARDVKARPATRRGSKEVEPVSVDNQLLFVQRGGRALREFAFVFEVDGYKAPSMTQLAGHIGVVPFAEMAYAQEPHSIVWVRREDGTMAGLTYNRDENVIGWHQQDFAGGYVESITVIPQSDGLQDALWLSVVREVGGEDKRYIERLTRFWDFDTELEDAFFVDSGLVYDGAEIDTVYGLQHLEGEDVYGLTDGRPVGPLTVENGSVTLSYPASRIVLGLGFEGRGEIPRLESGASDGTAQGKTKRINSMVLSVWRSFGGLIGIYNAEAKAFVYEPLQYPGDYDVIEEITLYTGMIGPITPSPGYDMDGFIAFVRPKESPLPFNITAIMPQLNTQDR